LLSAEGKKAFNFNVLAALPEYTTHVPRVHAAAAAAADLRSAGQHLEMDG
jgi:hypothetical protein